MRPTRLTRPQNRSTYARTGLDFLINDPNGFPSAYPPGIGSPPLWWYGEDTGGGAYPIGPNGPYSRGSVGAVPAVIRATALITGPISAAPFTVNTAGSPKETPRWLTDPMLLKPDARYPGVERPAVRQLPRSLFWTEWVRSAIWWGVGAFMYVPDATGAPTPGLMWNVPSRLLTTERDSGDALVWSLADPAGGDPVVFDRSGAAGPWRIAVLRNPHSPIDTEGHSRGVFAMSPGVFALAGQVESYASGTFRSGIPAGYLQVQTPGLTAPAAEELKDRWMAAHGGDRRSIAVLNATTSFQPLNLSPVDAALDQVKRLNMADVAFAFGLDPMTLGVGLANSATYTNLRDAWANHRDFGLAPWTAGVEDVLTALAPGNTAVKVNLDGFANPTAAERFAAWQVALDAGIVTVDEVRAAEHLPAMPTGDATPEATTRSLSAAETSQKVYLAVDAGVISIVEARQMIADAGGNIDPEVVPEKPTPAPAPQLQPVATEPAEATP